MGDSVRKNVHLWMARHPGQTDSVKEAQRSSLEAGVRRGKLASGVLLAAYFMAALLFTQMYFDAAHEWRQAPLEELATFTAAKPFQYRVLFPFLIRVVQSITDFSYYGISKSINVLVTFGLIVVFRNYLALFFSKNLSAFAGLLILYPMYWHYCVYGFWRTTSDLPAIMFFLLGLGAIFNRNWTQYYIIFVLGTFNRETIAFLTLAFSLILFRRNHPRFVALHVLVQLLILAGVRCILAWVFSANEGGWFQLQLFSDPQKILSLESVKPILLSFGGLWIFLPFGWRDQHPFVKHLLWICPPFYLLMAVVGNLHELRIFNELIPLVTTSALYGIKGVTANLRSAFFPQRPS